ncbi:MAG: ABC transporter substrate-binding protein [Nitrospinota bacterium]
MGRDISIRRFFVAVAVLAALALIALPGVGGALEGKSVKIGVLTMLTGPLKHNGQHQKESLTVALNDLKKKGGIGGVPVELIFFDTHMKNEQAIAGFRKLVRKDKVLAIIGPFLSNQVKAVSPIANELETVMFSASSANPRLRGKLKPWGFRNSIFPPVAMKLSVSRWVKDNNIKSAAIMYDNRITVMKVTGTRILPGLLKKLGVNVVDKIGHQSNSVDFSAEVTRIRAKNPDGILMSSGYGDAGKIAREVRKQGMKTALYGGIDVSQAQYIKIGLNATEGTYSTSTLAFDANTPEFKHFYKEYMKVSGDVDPHFTAAQAYENLLILAKVIESSGVTNRPGDLASDRKKIRDGLTKVKGFQGPTGIISIGPHQDAEKKAYILKVVNGHWKTLN